MNGQTTSQFNNQFYSQTPQYELGLGTQRADSVDSNVPNFPNYGVQPPLFNQSMPPISMQQMQYQQALLTRGAPQMNNFYPGMQTGFGGFSNGSPAVDHFRNQNASSIQNPPQNMSPSPMMGTGFAPPGFGGMAMGMGAYGYNGMQMPGVGYGMQQEQQVNGRRGRVGISMS
jgi:protein JSN1